MLDSIQNLVGTLIILGIPVSLLVEILKKIPNKYWAFPNENGDYGTIAATTFSVLAVLIYAYFQKILNVANIETLATLIIGTIPVTLGIYNLTKRVYLFFRTRIGK